MQRHLDGIEATVALLSAQLAALRHALQHPPAVTPVAREVGLERQLRCLGVADEHCALRNEEAKQSRATFGDRQAWRCAGCAFESGTEAVQQP